MYDICHPEYYNMTVLGCKDELKIATAFYVYMELCEVRKLWDVEYKYEPKMDLIYITAKEKKDSNSEIYIPWSVKTGVRLCDFEEIQKNLQCLSFILAIISGERVSIFYKVSDGLVKPNSYEFSGAARTELRKKIELERELKRNSRNLYELATSSTAWQDK